MATLNPYKVKWGIVIPVNSEMFGPAYLKALKYSNFVEINGFFANHFNSENPVSVKRFQDDVKKLAQRISGLSNKRKILSFIITDKQFGMIGSAYRTKCNVVSKIGNIPVTYKQMYEEGCIPLPGSQARENHPNLALL